MSFALDDLDRKVLRHLPDRPGIFVEAGAHDGLTQSNTAMLEFSFGWTGLLVEPIPELAARCRLEPSGGAGRAGRARGSRLWTGLDSHDLLQPLLDRRGWPRQPGARRGVARSVPEDSGPAPRADVQRRRARPHAVLDPGRAGHLGDRLHVARPRGIRSTRPAGPRARASQADDAAGRDLRRPRGGGAGAGAPGTTPLRSCPTTAPRSPRGTTFSTAPADAVTFLATRWAWTELALAGAFSASI